jgi:hypothetical protein
LDYKKIGKITHYFDRIQVAVLVATEGEIKVGDMVRFGEDGGAEQKIESLQVDHKPVELIKKGEESGLKVSVKVKPGAVVYKVA